MGRATDPMDAYTMEAVAAGVSTRKYRGTLERLARGAAEHATSSSAVSGRFVALSTRRMHEFLSRGLDELDIRVVFIDGKAFRDHCLLIALGLDSQGRKHVLGLREGSTENVRVARALLSELVERGLTYGELAQVQRCRAHKSRNVLGHLPQHMHASVARTLRDAWESESAELAKRQLQRLARSLDRDHPF